MSRKMMTDEEVLRAVECCGTEQCSKCPYNGDCCGDDFNENYLAEDVKRVIVKTKDEAKRYRNKAKSQATEIVHLLNMNKELKKQLHRDDVSRAELMVALDCCSADSVRACVKCPYFDVRDCTMRLLARAKKEIERLELRASEVK